MLFIKLKIAANWSDVTNRRKFFENFAKLQNFDPKIPGNWYSQARHSILSSRVCNFILELVCSFYSFGLQGGNTILNYHNGNIGKALDTIFPDIGIDPSVFSSIKITLFQIAFIYFLLDKSKLALKHRHFFKCYATHYNFDAENPSLWYSQPRERILAFKVPPLILYKQILILQ